jgi:hypothetical protein
MPRPQITADIEVPSIDTPMAGFVEQACGQSYNVEFDVHQAYRGVDHHVYHLDKLADAWPSQPGNHLSKAELAHLPQLAGIAAKAIVSAQAMLDGEDASLPVQLTTHGENPVEAGVLRVVDSANREAIQHLIDIATSYGSRATKLWLYWAEEWRPTVLEELPGSAMGLEYIRTQLPGWPLDRSRDAALPPCSAAQPETPIQWSGPDWGAWVQCPTLSTTSIHAEDVRLFGDLVRAAMLWARCAQEAAAVVGLHYLNKRKWEKEQPLAYAPTGPTPSTSSAEGPAAPAPNVPAFVPSIPPPVSTAPAAPQPTQGSSTPPPWKIAAAAGALAFLAWRASAR